MTLMRAATSANNLRSDHAVARILNALEIILGEMTGHANTPVGLTLVWNAEDAVRKLTPT
jgi:hypothetical protein